MAKRKGLMEVLSDYRREEAQKREYKAKKTPDYSKKAAGAKSSTKKAFAGKPLGGSGSKKKTATQVAFSSGSFMKTKPTGTTSGTSGTKKEEVKINQPPAPARQQAATTRDNRNRGMTGYGYTGGRGGKPTPPQTRPVYNRRGRKIGEEVVQPPSDKPKRKFNRRGREIK